MFPIEAGDINPESRIIPHLPGERLSPLGWVPCPGSPHLPSKLPLPPPSLCGLDLENVLTGSLVPLPGPVSAAVVRRAAGRREPPGHAHRVLQHAHEPAGQDLPLPTPPGLLQGAPGRPQAPHGQPVSGLLPAAPRRVGEAMGWRTLPWRGRDFPQVTDEGTAAQRGEATCPKVTHLEGGPCDLEPPSILCMSPPGPL